MKAVSISLIMRFLGKSRARWRTRRLFEREKSRLYWQESDSVLEDLGLQRDQLRNLGQTRELAVPPGSPATRQARIIRFPKPAASRPANDRTVPPERRRANGSAG